ncbi:hypothetical protein PG984_014811 [Apiospora sp. TS-2023a]
MARDIHTTATFATPPEEQEAEGEEFKIPSPGSRPKLWTDATPLKKRIESLKKVINNVSAKLEHIEREIKGRDPPVRFLNRLNRAKSQLARC